jgi:hypothetical protein
MNVIKFLVNDYVMFIFNILTLVLIYLVFIDSRMFSLLIEILMIGIIYYFFSLLYTFCIVILIYLKVKKSFRRNLKWNIFKKLEIVSSVFDKYFDEIDYIDDLKLKISQCN